MNDLQSLFIAACTQKMQGKALKWSTYMENQLQKLKRPRMFLLKDMLCRLEKGGWHEKEPRNNARHEAMKSTGIGSVDGKVGEDEVDVIEEYPEGNGNQQKAGA